MDGYIQALIDIHYNRLSNLNDNQKNEQRIEMNFIEELENLKKYLSSKNKED